MIERQQTAANGGGRPSKALAWVRAGSEERKSWNRFVFLTRRISPGVDLDLGSLRQSAR